MKITIVWWHPSKLQEILPKEVNVGTGKHFPTLENFIQYLTGWNLNVAIPKDFSKFHLVYVDEGFFQKQ